MKLEMESFNTAIHGVQTRYRDGEAEGGGRREREAEAN